MDAPPDYGRAQRRELRKTIESALTDIAFSLAEPVMVRDEGRFFILKLDYASAFPPLAGLRPHIQVEVSFRTPKLPPVPRSVQSFVAQTQGDTPEVSSINCADPIEAGAEKLSALSWRVLSYRTGSDGHDPSMIRHLHDLAALESRILPSPMFASLAREIITLDSNRGDQTRPKEFGPLLQAMLEDLSTHDHWQKDYDTFIREVSYATDEQRISFRMALVALGRIVLDLRC